MGSAHVFDLGLYGGERGIRTLDRVSPIHAFQACAFNHSAISPMLKRSGYQTFNDGAQRWPPPCMPPPPPADTLLPPRAEENVLAPLPLLAAEPPALTAGMEAVVPPTAAPPRIGEPVAASRPMLPFK